MQESISNEVVKPDSLKRTARTAGLWYLIMAVTGPIGLVIVPAKILLAGDAAATAQNVITNEMLFRIGIVSNLVCQITFLFLVLALVRLFKGISEWHSKLMLVLVIAAVPIAILVELAQLATLQILNGEDYLKVFNSEQLNALALLFLQIHEQGLLIASIFWGLWLFPFGYLAIKSRFIPKILGVLLIIGGVTYLVDSSLALLNPLFRKSITDILLLPLGIGEISMVLWLLIKGVREKDLHGKS